VCAQCKHHVLAPLNFRNLIWQISVPHNEIDKVDKGGLDKITLIEVIALSFFMDTQVLPSFV
jgi:hypothetical protein